MMRRPLIGLSGRRKKGRDIVNNLAVIGDSDVDLYYVDYTRAVLAAGGLPLHLPLDVDPAHVADRLDGVLLTGGGDIGPDRYGHPTDPDTQPIEFERDEYEMALLDQVFKHELATLGICRGIQMINVHAGGTLHQHVPAHAGFEFDVTHHLHDVELTADSALGAMYGERRDVNSLHHQTIDMVGADLRVTARSDDGTVEGLEHTELPMVAVQWHPEMMTTAAQDPIFTWLVQAASKRD